MKKFLFLIIISLNLISCVEKTTLSGKIIQVEDLDNLNLRKKNDLYDKFGEPSYIDNLENKFFYYTEKKKSKNFYNQNTIYSYLLIFKFDENDIIVKAETIDLLKKDKKKFKDKITPNAVVKRGLIEKIFGGVGTNQVPNSQ